MVKSGAETTLGRGREPKGAAGSPTTVGEVCRR